MHATVHSAYSDRDVRPVRHQSRGCRGVLKRGVEAIVVFPNRQAIDCKNPRTNDRCDIRGDFDLDRRSFGWRLLHDLARTAYGWFFGATSAPSPPLPAPSS